MIMPDELIKKCFMLSPGHIDILNAYRKKTNCTTEVEALRFMLNDVKKEAEQ